MIKNIKIRNKILLMVLMPLLGLVYFSYSEVSAKKELASKMEIVHEYAVLAVKASALVHELQKERGMTAGFLGSKGNSFGSELQGQRLSSDEKAQALRSKLDEIDQSKFSDNFKSIINIGMANIQKIDSIRDSVSNLKISAADAIGFYSNTNAQFLDVISEIAKESVNAELSTLVTSYVSFLQGKERAGIERAVLANVFATDKFTPALFQKFVSLVSAQELMEKQFFDFARKEHIAFYKSTMSGEFVSATQKMRKVAVSKAQQGKFNIEPKEWFNMQTGKINLLKNVEDKISNDLLEISEEIGAQASTAVIIGISIIAIVFSIAIFSVVTIARSI